MIVLGTDELGQLVIVVEDGDVVTINPEDKTLGFAKRYGRCATGISEAFALSAASAASLEDALEAPCGFDCIDPGGYCTQGDCLLEK